MTRVMSIEAVENLPEECQGLVHFERTNKVFRSTFANTVLSEAMKTFNGYRSVYQGNLLTLGL